MENSEKITEIEYKMENTEIAEKSIFATQKDLRIEMSVVILNALYKYRLLLFYYLKQKFQRKSLFKNSLK